MAANKFTLKGHGIEVQYTIGANTILPALTFKNGTITESFKPIDIRTDDTGLGTLVSVLVIRSIDNGGERFGFFLPEIDVPKGQIAKFITVGVFERFSGPDTIPHRPTTWNCFELHGTAQSVIVPLEATVPA
jgi:hypothetical protein